MSSDSIAKKKAIENGFDGVIYVGKEDDKKIYLGVTDDRRPTGLPLFITVDPDGSVTDRFTHDYMYLVKE